LLDLLNLIFGLLILRALFHRLRLFQGVLLGLLHHAGVLFVLRRGRKCFHFGGGFLWSRRKICATLTLEFPGGADDLLLQFSQLQRLVAGALAGFTLTFLPLALAENFFKWPNLSKVHITGSAA